MAHRSIDTAWWDDPYVGKLSPETKYLYLYLQLNKHSHVANCYKITSTQIALETGLTINQVYEGLTILEEGEKLKHADGWLALTGGITVKGAKLQAAVDKQLATAPAWVSEYMLTDKTKDTRGKHAAILAARTVMQKYPSRKEWDTLIEVIGDSPDIPRLQECYTEWANRGYSKFNYNWVYDWYVNKKIPKRRDNGIKSGNADTLDSYYNEFKQRAK